VELAAAAEVYWKILNQGPTRDQTEASRRLINLYANKRLGFTSTAIFGPKNREAFAKSVQDYSRLISLPNSQYQVGEMFLRGDALPEDKPQAVRWLMRAAQGSSAAAMNRLGTLWMAGVGGQPDPQESVNWYRKAAARGFAEAQYNLGVCHAEGKGVAPDPVEAWRWLQLAAAQNFRAAAAERDKIQARLTPTQLADARQRAASTEISTNAPAAAPATNATRLRQFAPQPERDERAKQ
jgi:hypothetical protein